MSRSNDNSFKAFGYVARPRRTEVREGAEQQYWTVRCRRQEDQGEWSLGWFPTRRQAEAAFDHWVEKRRRKILTPVSQLTILEVIDRYLDAVDGMDKRPNTKMNRQYTAKQFREFIEGWGPRKPIRDFDAAGFEQYLMWLRDVRGYSPQTIENALIGARTFLRWATPTYLAAAPKPPDFHVPQNEAATIYEEDVKATIAKAEPPLDLLLRLIWETGFRFAEAATIRACDIDVAESMVAVAPRGSFRPKTRNSQRRVPITEDLARDLLALGSGDDGPLFACGDNNPYAYWRHRLNKAHREAGINGFKFHDLRRAMADRLRKSGVTVDVYCRMMGHSPITGLRHYAIVDNDDLRDAHEAGLANGRKRRRRPSKQ